MTKAIKKLSKNSQKASGCGLCCPICTHHSLSFKLNVNIRIYFTFMKIIKDKKKNLNIGTIVGLIVLDHIRPFLTYKPTLNYCVHEVVLQVFPCKYLPQMCIHKLGYYTNVLR